MSYLIAFFLAFVTAVGVTPVVRGLARGTRFVAPVRKDRWHQKPTALLGGIGIYAGFLVGYAYLRLGGQLTRGGLLVACASAMFVLGLVDDFVQLKPYTKLVAQLVAAVVQTAFGLSFDWTPWPIVNQGLTIFWLVGVTNALNLLDNIDGLSAGISLLAALFMAYLLATGGFVPEAKLVLVFAAAAAGFLVFNFHPASIFMGDSGSLFLGFFLGGAALYQTKLQASGGNLIAVLGPPVLVLALPILDTTLVTVTRRLEGRPISQGGRDHASHRLVELGLSERGATLTLYGLATLSGIAGVVASRAPQSITLGLLPVFLLVVFFVAIFLARVKVYKRVVDPDAPPANTDSDSKARLPTFVNFAYKRRVIEVLNDFVLIMLAYYGAFLLRFDGEWVEPHFTLMTRSLPMVAVAQLLTLLLSGVYGGLWRYTSLADIRRIVGSSAFAGMAGAGVVFLAFHGFAGFSRAMFLLDTLLLLMGLAASRVSFRLMRDWLIARADDSKKRRVLVYGAGDAGELVVRELRQNGTLGMVAVGFVDDDRTKQGVIIHGIPVLGGRAKLPALFGSLSIQDVVLSTAHLDPADFTDLETMCRDHSVRLRRMKIGWQ